MNVAGRRLLSRMLLALAGAFLVLALASPTLARLGEGVKVPLEQSFGAVEGSSTFLAQARLFAAVTAAAAILLAWRLRREPGEPLWVEPEPPVGRRADPPATARP